MSFVFGSENRAYSSLANATPDIVRAAICQNQYAGHTAGLCDGLPQYNLVLTPQVLASGFETYCGKNPVPCPLLGVSTVGDYRLDTLGNGVDIRTDLPLYNIYEHGERVCTERDILVRWRDDFVAFAIGYSFTFERALMVLGIGIRHIKKGVAVPMFKANIMTNKVGPFGGPTVVSMRPIKTTDLDAVCQICASYPHAHGMPLHVGDPSKIGIVDLNKPKWGAAVSINENELPFFWGCGVTTQVAITDARPALSITHAPGAMLITKIDEKSNSDRRPAELPKEKLH